MRVGYPMQNSPSPLFGRRRLEEGAGQQWDPRIVSVFVQWVQQHQAPAVAATLAPVASSAA